MSRINRLRVRTADVLGGSEIAELLERHGLSARKSLGQNFVADPNTVERIVAEAGVGKGSRVVEVGPGIGSLSLAILEAGAELVAVEKDGALQPVLEEVLSRVPGARWRLVNGDALEMDWGAELGAEPHTLIANLPYNVAVPIIMGVLARAGMVDPLVVMVQREVADRLVAEPGGKTIGVPTLKAAWYSNARVVMHVPPTVFIPRPRVESAVVRFDRREPPAADPRPVFSLFEKAYGQRRKMLRRSLGPAMVGPLEAAGIDPTARPESLNLEDWVRLAGHAQSGVGP